MVNSSIGLPIVHQMVRNVNKHRFLCIGIVVEDVAASYLLESDLQSLRPAINILSCLSLSLDSDPVGFRQHDMYTAAPYNGDSVIRSLLKREPLPFVSRSLHPEAHSENPQIDTCTQSFKDPTTKHK